MMDYHTIYDYFRNAALNNQFAQGGFAIAVFSGVFLCLKKWWNGFRTWFLRKTTMKIEILSEDAAYSWCQLWLANSKFGKKTQTLMVRDDGKGSCSLVPGTGRHFFFYKRRLFWLINTVEQTKLDGIMVGQRKSVVIHIIPGHRRIGEEFIREAEDHYNAKNKTMINVFSPTPWNDGWRLSNTVLKRPMNSVVLNVDTADTILKDIQKFKNNKIRYNALNIPWRRGYLLYGKPGNGKTSLALAIASEFDYSLHILSLSSLPGDQKLRNLCEVIPENAVLLIEDIDCSKLTNRTDEDDDEEQVSSGVTLSGMLNALDGVTSGEGRILIMTTNHPEKLDPALIRPGRADCHIEISSPTPYQVATLFERFYGDKDIAVEFSQGLDYERLSMAQLQVYMLKHDTAQSALQHKEELVFELDKDENMCNTSSGEFATKE